MTVDKNIFRAYDIRGKYPAQINEELANKIGKAYGNLIGAGKEIIIGKDLRSSGETLKKALIEGMNFSGVNVIDLGTVPTPVVYFAICKENKHGGLVVTGSHLTYGWNGIKLCRENADCLTYETGIKEILDNVVNDNFQEAKEKGSVVKKDIVEEYLEYMRSKVKLEKKLKVIIDIGNGTGGEIAKKIFERLNCEVKYLFPEMDETFPNHVADPIKEDTLKCLQEEVVKEKADLGVAFDGDCDRAGFVDEKGNIVRGDMALILFAKQALKNKETKKFLFEVRCSRLTYEKIKEMGGEPEFMRVGHSYIMQRAREEKAVAGELSGHFYFPEFYYDDGFLAALKMMETLSNSDKTLSEMLDFEMYCSTPEIRIDYPDDKKFEFVERVKKVLCEKRFELVTVDGVRVEKEDGWYLIRASNTEPRLVLRIEGNTPEALKKLEDEAMELVRQEAGRDGIII